MYELVTLIFVLILSLIIFFKCVCENYHSHCVGLIYSLVILDYWKNQYLKGAEMTDNVACFKHGYFVAFAHFSVFRTLKKLSLIHNIVSHEKLYEKLLHRALCRKKNIREFSALASVMSVSVLCIFMNKKWSVCLLHNRCTVVIWILLYWIVMPV